ncbi:hypothetical protein B0H17DRAFT_1076570, partial [Mycena rosella]
ICRMFIDLYSIAMFTLTVLVLGQGAVAVPQTLGATCGGASDPPCPGIQHCCVNSNTGTSTQVSLLRSHCLQSVYLRFKFKVPDSMVLNQRF